jgi:hypothetical protein
MHTMMHQRSRPGSLVVAQWERERSTSRELDQDRQQMAVLNAANILKGHA